MTNSLVPNLPTIKRALIETEYRLDESAAELADLFDRMIDNDLHELSPVDGELAALSIQHAHLSALVREANSVLSAAAAMN